MKIRSILVLLAMSLCTLHGQKAEPPIPLSPNSSQPDPPLDAAKLFADIGASYYHADDLSGMDCGVVLDWTTLSRKFGNVPADESVAAEGVRQTRNLQAPI